MPWPLDLLGFNQKAQQFLFVGIQQLGVRPRDSFCRFCCPHPNDGVLVP